MMDTVGNKVARAEIEMIQAFGGAGVSQVTPLAGIRTLRLADGPDEVHKNQIARFELQKHMQR